MVYKIPLSDLLSAADAWNLRASTDRATSMPCEPITFWYRNYKGEEGYRRVQPISVRYGTSEWHKEPQWLLLAADLVNDKLREFAMRDISGVVGPPVLALLSPQDGTGAADRAYNEGRLVMDSKQDLLDEVLRLRAALASTEPTIAMAESQLEIDWLRRLLTWCRARLKKDVYQSALDGYLAAGPTVPDETKIIQSASPSSGK